MEENVPHLLRAIKEELEDCEVVITTPKTLARVLNSGELRSRSDFDKIATLTKMIAWFHQYQRPYTLVDGKKIHIQLASRCLLCAGNRKAANNSNVHWIRRTKRSTHSEL